MEEKTILTEKLDNGLVLEISDASRKIAADRWHVVCWVRIPVPVAEYMDEDKRNEIETVFGKSVLFEKKLERIFISDDDKQAVSDGLLNSYLSSVKNYLSHPGFPKKFLLKEYQDHMKKRNYVVSG